MKIILFLFLAFLFIHPVKGQTGRDIFLYETTFYFDQNGSPLTEAEFQNALKENPAEFHMWDQIENDSVRVSRLIPKKEKLKVSYPDVFKSVEKITGSSLAGNPVIIIFYDYTNDLCSPASSFNNWDTLRIRKDKRAADNLKRRIQQQYPNVIAYHFFEPGITIEPSQLHKEYFFLDRDHYFRKGLFKTQASCGSIAIIKPGGATIIHHGETAVPVITSSLFE
ncbi:hypothetical protein FHG64_05275 [Antarcticibacterium flavum]|uniref:Uncharacterized protein n=1 Tax=Antarcticibacterium flavum TaxID=2058175 RepID=A0A5B7X0J6_9FLAO|nr:MULTISPECIES: hypothetical protein [Antarcticibacterium]MCM4159856.1 hypothetical protein [Antarcticibacterium sp. W02-3]QCY68857.1 hypothetical protein FHG64_05275 [Antarcticibacterium flavum]